jgi:hypothetical protein
VETEPGSGVFVQLFVAAGVPKCDLSPEVESGIAIADWKAISSLLDAPEDEDLASYPYLHLVPQIHEFLER